MPRIPLEPLVPWPQSLRWAIHDAYFENSGVTPWESGAVPWRWTSCFPAARQIERFVVDHLAAQGAPSRPLRIVEAGCGNGAFVSGFFRALAEDRRPTARAVAPHVVYTVTDATATIPDAIARGFLAKEAERGRLVPGVYPVGRGGLCDLAGDPIAGPVDVLVANYVVCATATDVWRFDGTSWFERYAQLHAVDDEGRSPDALRALALAGELSGDAVQVDFAWQEADPHARTSPTVAATLDVLASRQGPLTACVPSAFLTAMDELDPGLIVVSDFGQDAVDAVRGDRPCLPVSYGRSLAHPVDFAVLDAWAIATGRSLRRTHDGRAVAVAAIGRTQPFRFARAFRTADASRFLDLSHAGATLDRMGEPSRAVTLLELARTLDPREPELLQRLGEALVRAGRPTEGLRVLRRGKRIDDRLDFDLTIGLALLALGRAEAAVAAFRTSCERFDTAESATRLGNAYEALRMYDYARVSYEHALSRTPGFGPATRFLAALDEAAGATEPPPLD